MFKRVNRLAIELPRPKAPDPNGASVVIRPGISPEDLVEIAKRLQRAAGL